MIIAEQKPLEEIKSLIAGAEKVLVVGCGTCVTVCFAGGEKEAGILASSLRIQYPPAIKVIEVPCSGRVDILHILRAFEDGVDAALVAG